MHYYSWLVGLMVAAAVCASAARGQAGPEPACIVMNQDRLPLVERESPLDSVVFTIAGAPAKICYSRPTAQGRTMIGGPTIPYGRLWRTGANEPTMIHTTVALMVAGIRLEPGSYSVYTIPGRGQWRLILNRSTSQWGEESNYDAAVRESEVGRASVPSERIRNYVERFTIRVQPADRNHALIYLEWENTQVTIPVAGG